MIYFIRCESFVKIGYSANPAKRFHQIQCANPHPVKILGVMDGDKSDEASLHGRFSHLKSRLEWFRLAPELQAFIDQNTRPYKRTKLVMVAGIPMERGSRGEIAAALNITSSALSQWKRVPPNRAIAVERLTGISRHDLCPDVFGPAPRKGRAA